MSPNYADGMANSVDPDQTAPVGAVWSGSALFAQICVQKLRKITVLLLPVLQLFWDIWIFQLFTVYSLSE